MPARRTLTALPLLAATVAVGLGIVGCGGDDERTGDADGGAARPTAVQQVEAACTELAGRSVWLPAHVADEDLSSAETTAVIARSEETFRTALTAIDAPEELRAPIERLTEPAATPASRAAAEANLDRTLEIYREIGAETCAKQIEASKLVLGGSGVEQAYEQVGATLPERPADW